MSDLPTSPGTPISPFGPRVPGEPCGPRLPGSPGAPTQIQRNILIISVFVYNSEDYKYFASMDQHYWSIDKYE